MKVREASPDPGAPENYQGNAASSGIRVSTVDHPTIDYLRSGYVWKVKGVPVYVLVLLIAALNIFLLKVINIKNRMMWSGLNGRPTVYMLNTDLVVCL